MNDLQLEKKYLLEALELDSISDFHGGEFIKRFESEFASYIGCNNAVAVNSGTAALHTALAALDIKNGDEVIVPAYSFVSSASVIVQQNAIPVFVDIDPDTLQICPDAILKKLSSNTKAVITVHLYGYASPIRDIMRIAEQYGIFVIEDCAQSLGSKVDDLNLGTFGHMACFSFAGEKHITTGEGGMIVTSDDDLADKCHIIRQNGKRDWNTFICLGYNYRMTELQAAFGFAQMLKLDEMNNIRKKRQDLLFNELDDISSISVIKPLSGTSPVLFKFPFLFDHPGISREAFLKSLRESDLPVEEGYSIPLNKLPYLNFCEKTFKNRICDSTEVKGFKNDMEHCPVADEVAEKIVNIKLHPRFHTDEQIETCVYRIKDFLK